MSVFSSSLYSHDAGTAIAEAEEAPSEAALSGIEEHVETRSLPASHFVPVSNVRSVSNRADSSGSRLIGPWVVIAIGVTLAMMVASAGRSRPTPTRFARQYELKNGVVSKAIQSSDLRHLDRLGPQSQAETLLQLAVDHSDGAVEQISSRIERWQGKLQWTPQMAELTTAALNSGDMRVRQSAIEVELSAYGLSKNPDTLNYVLRETNSSDHARRLWALWALGLLGSGGVERDRVSHELGIHLADTDEDARYWAAEGLAITASDEAITSLLAAMHNDPSPRVREASAGGLAISGMFTSAQRLSAVPQLLNYIDDSNLDEQTHAWAFQALAEITRQELPDDAAAWRRWYKNQGPAAGN